MMKPGCRKQGLHDRFTLKHIIEDGVVVMVLCEDRGDCRPAVRWDGFNLFPETLESHLKQTGTSFSI